MSNKTPKQSKTDKKLNNVLTHPPHYVGREQQKAHNIVEKQSKAVNRGTNDLNRELKSKYNSGTYKKAHQKFNKDQELANHYSKQYNSRAKIRDNYDYKGNKKTSNRRTHATARKKK